MRGISVGVIREEEEKDEDIRNGKRESDRGGSWAGLLVHPQHRRTKSASDRNFYGFRGKDQNVTDGSLQQSGSAHVNKSMSSKHRASLEKDIEQLQSRLKQERSMRLVLERAMGRASSTLSPGHRHFAAQTKELMAEIESLEEEVSSREQHVLTMYRNIFEQCVTRPSSQQSSMMASPAHPKQEGARKHPTIISTAFCSSKNFPFRSPFQALVDPGKRSRDDPATAKNLRSGPTKVEAIMGKASMARTLREHLHECPSKLSEEMVRCMAAVYCWLRTRENRSPFPSRSCTNVVQPRQDVCPASMLHISSISSDKTHFARASYAITTYRLDLPSFPNCFQPCRLLVEQLQKVSVSLMPIDAQTAFWINVYNALIMHAYLAYGIPNTSFRRLALFQKAAYNIGGRIISANAIEHSIFCFRTPRVGWWLETILLATLRKKSGEDKQLSSKLGLPNSQPIVCFALCTGAFSDPVLRVYTALNVKEELEEATREFLQSNVVVKKTRKVFLPKLLERFAREACYGSDDLLKWLVQNVDNKLGDSIQKCLDSNKSGKKISEWLPYSSRFRYVFSKGLAQKPWWL